MSLKDVAGKMRGAFKEAKQKIDEQNQPLPEGEYVAKLQQCSLQKSKSSENMYIGLAYYILEGEEKGKTVYDNSMVIIPEKAESLIRFFDRFGFDTDAMLDDPEVIEQYTEQVHQSAPTVKIRSKHNEGKDGKIYYNVYLNKILDMDAFADAMDATGTTEEADDGLDGLDGLDKKALKEIIFADDSDVDISAKFIASHTEEEIIAEIRSQRATAAESVSETDETSNDEDEELRQRLYTLCQAQGIEEATDEMTLNELKAVIYDPETGSGYTFDTFGKEAINDEEIQTLIDAGFDDRINRDAPEPPKPKAKTKTPPPPPPKKGRK